MKAIALLASLSLLLSVSSNLTAADLTAIDRSIAKEPVYQTKTPRYCLLVLGPEAKTRIWLVQDGHVLYVDRNANGDLTEEGEKVTGEKWDGAEEGETSFKIGELRDGPLTHKAVTVGVSRLNHLAENYEQVKSLLKQDPKARGCYVSAEIEWPGFKGAGIGGRVRQHAGYVDLEGVLQFADRPKDAPIVNLSGPLRITLFGRHKLMIDRETDAVLGVATAGLGPGTTAWIDFECIPRELHPVVEVVYPPKQPSEPGRPERYELKQRC